MNPINIEIIMPMLTTLEFGCSKCGIIYNQLNLQKEYRASCTEEYPEDWQQEIANILETVRGLSSLYKHRIRFKFIDAQSPLGLWKQIRHRVSKLPAFIVDKRYACSGCDMGKLESHIDMGIHEASRKFVLEVTRRAGNL